MASKFKLPTLLLITDNPSITHWMKKHLQEQFYILVDSRLSSALQTLSTTELDFIILDGNIESEECFDLARALRQANQITPILLITGKLRKSYRDEALEAGVSDFLNNQLDVEELETRIATGLKAASARNKTSELSTFIKGSEPQLSAAFLKNKVQLNEKASKLLEAAKAAGKALSLLIVRLDNFQQLAEKEGRSAEELLLPLSSRLSRLLRPKDLLIPATDEHFILLLPDTPPSAASDLAARLCQEVEKEPFSLSGKALHLTISIAVSPLSATEEDYKRIVASANRVLQEASGAHNLIISLEKEYL